MNTMACMITGQRKFESGKIERVRQEIRREVLAAIEDGYTHFISGFDEGVGMIFADIVAELKTSNPIRLEAALAYRGRVRTTNKEFWRLIGCCDVSGICSEERSVAGTVKRNSFMVQNSRRVISVFDSERSGRRSATVRYALSMGREVRRISV